MLRKRQQAGITCDYLLITALPPTAREAGRPVTKTANRSTGVRQT